MLNIQVVSGVVIGVQKPIGRVYSCWNVVVNNKQVVKIMINNYHKEWYRLQLLKQY